MKLLACQRFRSSQPRSGIVLVVVMVLVVMIAMAGFGFVASMSTERQGTELHGDAIQAEAAVASAELYIAQLLDMPAAERALAGGMLDNPDLFRGVPLQPAVIAVSEQEQRGEQTEPWRFTVVAPGFDAETTLLRFGLQNESARLNIATLMQWERDNPGSAHRALMALPGMTPDIADSLPDWIDEDDATRDQGAESDFYGQLRRPYEPRNSIPAFVEELQLVRGINRLVLFGVDHDRNGFIDPLERSATFDAARGGSDDIESTQLGLSNWITLYSAESNVDRFGRARVNLNGPDLPALRQSLSEFLPLDIVEFVLLWREYGVAPPGLPAGQIATIADMIDAVVQVPQGSDVSTVSSPLTLNSESTREYLPLLLERTTTSPEKTIVGRINIHEAPQPVLAAIPGISEGTVDRILQQRRDLDDRARQSVAWLLTDAVLPLQTFKAVLPWITAGGDVYRAQIVAFRHNERGPVRRHEVVFDAANSRARRVCWKDLSAQGPGYPLGMLSPEQDRQQLVSNQFSSTSNPEH